MRPLSFVSKLVQERNSTPNRSREDHSLMNQHIASMAGSPSSDLCVAVICFAIPFSLHFGGAMRFLIEDRNSGLYLHCIALITCVDTTRML